MYTVLQLIGKTKVSVSYKFKAEIKTKFNKIEENQFCNYKTELNRNKLNRGLIKRVLIDGGYLLVYALID